jgi:hypothetical protein
LESCESAIRRRNGQPRFQSGVAKVFRGAPTCSQGQVEVPEVFLAAGDERCHLSAQRQRQGEATRGQILHGLLSGHTAFFRARALGIHLERLAVTRADSLFQEQGSVTAAWRCGGEERGGFTVVAGRGWLRGGALGTPRKARAGSTADV